MTAKELIEYLSGFNPDENVCFIVVNPYERIKYDVECSFGISDAPRPVIGIQLDGSEPFDQEEVEAAEADERGEK